MFKFLVLLIVTAFLVSNVNSDKQGSSSYKDSSLSNKDTSSSYGANGKYLELAKRVQVLEEKIESYKDVLHDRNQNTSSLGETNAEELSKLTDKVENVEASVDPDANFWNSSETCGGVIIAQYGKLSYSQGSRLYSSSPLSRFSSCIWTVRANYRSKIRMTFLYTTASTFVTEFFIGSNGTHTTKTTNVVPLKTYLFKGPVILVSVLLRLGPVSVSIVFEGIGMLTDQDTEFRHYHYNGAVGNFNQLVNQSYLDPIGQSSLVPKKTIFSTVVINTERSNLAELQVYPQKTCLNSTLAIHHSADLQSEQIDSCCSSTCPSHTFYSLEGWFASSYSGLKSQDPRLQMKWTSRLNQSDSIDRCGGVVMGKTGKISYKRGSNYFNNERCVWVIYPFPKSAVSLTTVVNSMESTYDHLVITEIDKDIPTSTEISAYYRSSSNFTGRVVLVTFFTDSSVVRQGFEFTWEAIGPSDNSRKLDSEIIIHKPSESNPLSIKREASLPKGFSLYLLSSTVQDGGSLSMTLSKKSPICNGTTVKMFGSHGGNVGDFFNDIQQPCSTTGAESLTSPDGIGSIFLESQGLQKAVEFEIQLQQFAPDTSDVSVGDQCGGILHTTTGKINYKLEELYSNNERCIWIISPNPPSAEIELKLQKDGFEECCDYIIVNKINPDNGTLSSITSLITRTNNTMTFPGPILVVSFRSDGSVVGKGFALQYSGKGTLNNYPYTYQVIHREEPSGSFEFPESDMSFWDDGIFKENELTIIAYSNSVDGGEGSTAVNFNVTVENVILGMDENCNSDILNFYSSPSREGFFWAETYPKEKCFKISDGPCANCLKNTETGINDTMPHAFGSAYKAFLAIYKPVKSDYTNQSFHVHWDVGAASGCGGVLVEDSGSIAYKLGGKYKNSEQCIWTIHAPGASRIRFQLQTNGFEPCCDYIILNSLNANNGTLGLPEFLRAEERVITMDGPVVFVTFRTDGSVTGEGFSLLFSEVSGTGSASLNSTYYHEHGKRRNSSYSYPGHDDDFELEKNAILTYTFSPETTKNESFLRYGTKISIDSIHLGFDNETCTSDTLTFFDTGSRLGFNVTKSYTMNHPEEPSCHDAESTLELSCNECPVDESKAQQLSISSLYPAFIAIYKSNSDSTTTGMRKNMRISWVDLPRVPTPAA